MKKEKNVMTEIHNPASLDKRKIKERGIKSPAGKTVRIDERTEIVVPHNATDEEVAARIAKHITKVSQSRKLF